MGEGGEVHGKAGGLLALHERHTPLAARKPNWCLRAHARAKSLLLASLLLEVAFVCPAGATKK